MDIPSPDEILAALDDDQRVVATTIGPPVVVVAGAGTGKTRAITHRIAWAAASGVQDPGRVLAVTFTTRAAGEMRARLHALGVGGVQARTFHSAALRQVQHFWPGAYGTQLPEVTEKRFALVADAAGRHRLKVDTALLRDLSGEISWAKVSNVTPGEYPSLARSAGRLLASTDPETIARVFTTYEQVKADRGLIDFDDILLCAAALLSEHPDVASQVRSRYRHFVVDEYQDVSPLQQALLDLWLGDAGDVCVVGDPRQSIHAFAGARPSYLTGFQTSHPGARVVNLVRDYRSSPQVVTLANQVMSSGPGRRGFVAPPLVAQGRPGPDPVFAPAADEAEEARGAAQWLSALYASGVTWREMAILFRINAQSPAFEAALADQDIPYQVRGSERFYERPEIRQALATLRGAANAAPHDPALPGVRDALAGLGWNDSVPEGGGAARERWESWNALVDLASDIVDQTPDADLGVVVAALVERADRQHAPVGQGVTLATMHAAKGLEWDAVALVGVHEGTLPFVLAKTDEQLAEEHRLLYVGITRARTHLRVSWSGRRGRRPSRFLERVSGVAVLPSVEKSRPTRAEKAAAMCRVCGRALSTGTDRKLGRHTDCASSYDEALLASLKAWRLETAQAESVPAFVVFTDATLIAVAEARPSTRAEFLAVSGIGTTKWDKWGAALQQVLARHPE